MSSVVDGINLIKRLDVLERDFDNSRLIHKQFIRSIRLPIKIPNLGRPLAKLKQRCPMDSNDIGHCSVLPWKYQQVEG